MRHRPDDELSFLNNNHVLGSICRCRASAWLSSTSFGTGCNARLRADEYIRSGGQGRIFDVVISSGVLHHTKRCPPGLRRDRAEGQAGRHRHRRALQRLWTPADLYAIEADRRVRREYRLCCSQQIRDQRKADIWIKDQYFNPHETWHSIDDVIDWFAENEVEDISIAALPCSAATGKQRTGCSLRARRAIRLNASPLNSPG